MTPEQRALAGRIGGYTLHSRVDSKAHTAPARAGFMAKFEREVDPEGVLPEVERHRRAEAAMKAHMLTLAAKSARARRKRAPT